MIVAENLKKTYGRVTAIEDVSFEVGEGEILGFLGPNGAGKTTTMRILTGYTPPSDGHAVIGGHDVKTSPLECGGSLDICLKTLRCIRIWMLPAISALSPRLKMFPPENAANRSGKRWQKPGPLMLPIEP